MKLQTPVEPEKRALSFPRAQDRDDRRFMSWGTQLLPGGRWLLAWAKGGGDGCVHYFDLEERSPVAKILVPDLTLPAVDWRDLLVAVDFISDEANASGDHFHCLMQFNMASMHPPSTDCADYRIRVWRVKVKFNESDEGTFTAVGLEAECISSFSESSLFSQNYLTLYGSALAYSSSMGSSIIIVDWVQANGRAKHEGIQRWCIAFPEFLGYVTVGSLSPITAQHIKFD